MDGYIIFFFFFIKVIFFVVGGTVVFSTVSIDLETRLDMEVEFVASFSRHFPPLIISPSILSFSHPSYAMPSSFYRELDR